jgi:DNA-binding transcriptional LysR family regulator
MKPDVAKLETTSTELQDLRAFCRVADLGSVTAASKTLGETKGSVSRRIARLERALGVELLRRSPRLVRVTEDGAAYRLRVGRALELLDEANSEVQHARTVPAGHLRVTAPYDLGVSVFAPLVAGFVERFPAVSVELLLTETIIDFDASNVDIALRASTGLPDSSLVAHKLDDVSGGLFAAPRYLEAAGTPRRPDDLAQHRLLVSRVTRGSTNLVLRKRDGSAPVRLRVRVAITATDFTFCREAAVAGGGIALLPEVIARRDVEDGRLQPVLREYALLEASLYLVHPGTRFLLPKARAFRDYLLEAFAARKPRGRRATARP